MSMEGSVLTARDVMTSPVVTASPDTRVDEIVRLMLENNIGSVVIVGSKKEVLGIITEKDLIAKVLGKRRDQRNTLAKEIMSTPVITVEPDTPVSEVVKLMQSKAIGHIPVVENGRLTGIIAEGDVILFAPEFLEIARIRREAKRGLKR